MHRHDSGRLIDSADFACGFERRQLVVELQRELSCRNKNIFRDVIFHTNRVICTKSFKLNINVITP